MHRLELKAGVPLMLLRNLDPHMGLYNGTRMVVVNTTSHVLEYKLLKKDGEGQTVFIPRMIMDANTEEVGIPLRRKQFPVKVAFVMTINKAQGQSVKYVGLDLRTPVFSHGQLYVALSRCTHPQRVKVLLKREAGMKTKNIVYKEVLRGLI